MKIAVISDLHADSHRKDLGLKAPDDADILIFAGDITNNTCKSIEYINDRFQDHYALLILGNHEYYEAHKHKGSKSTLLNGALLDNETYTTEIKGVPIRFICSTLWSNLASNPKLFDANDYFDIYRLQNSIADFFYIPKFRSDTIIEKYNNNIDFLSAELAKKFDGKTVVVTHFAPHLASVNNKFANDKLTPYFVNSLPDKLFEDVDLWVHGHTHKPFDYHVGTCRVICNPVGYSHEFTQAAFRVLEL